MAPKRRSASQFDFVQWTSTARLSTKTRKALADNGLREKDTLLLMGPAEVVALQVPIAQQLLLRQALARLGNPAFIESPATPAPPLPATPEGPRTPPVQLPSPQTTPLSARRRDETAPRPLLDAGRALDQLVEALDDDLHLSQAQPAQNSARDYDPRVHLTLRASTKKAAKIFNFLPTKVKERIQRNRRDRLYFTPGDNGAVTMHQKDPESFHITPSEWNAANIRIMSHLLQTGDLSRADVELYLAYSVQVNDMVDIYEWNSVLQFDTRYRELQAEHDFQWGDLRLAAHSTILIPRRPSTQAPLGQQTRSRPAPASTGPREVCKNWLASGGKQCAFGPGCRYAHRFPDTQSPPTVQPTSKNVSASQTQGAA